MTNQKFKEQADLLWRRPILPPWVTSPFRSKERIGSGLRVTYTLRCVNEPFGQERTITFEFRNGILWLIHGDGESRTELAGMEAVEDEMGNFVAVFLSDCQAQAEP